MQITLIYAGLLAIIFFTLSWRVVQMRRVGAADTDSTLHRRVRGHANFAEYVPLILLMIGGLEVSGANGWVIHALGITLVVSRALHGYAFAFTDSFQFGRFWGTLLTFLLLVLGGVLCLWNAFY